MSHTILARRWLLLVLLMLPGCGSEGPELVPVSGKITFGGGPWPAAGGVLLSPLEAAEGEPVVPTIVDLAADGSFTAECTLGAGLVPGKYGVGVECWELPPDESRQEQPMGKSCVPVKYQSPATSGLTFEVPKGSDPIEVKFNVPRS